MQQQIIVDVMDDAEIKIESKGYTGPVCLAESQFLKDILGEEISRQLTPAFYQTEDNKTRKIIPLCG